MAFEAQLLLDDGKYQQGRRAGVQGDAQGRVDARAAPVAGRADRPRTSSSTSSARGSSTRRSSGTRTTRPVRQLPVQPPRDARRALHRGHGPQDRRGGQPLHRRRPQGAREVPRVAERARRAPACPCCPKVGGSRRAAAAHDRADDPTTWTPTSSSSSSSPTTPPRSPCRDAFVPVFHRWIQRPGAPRPPADRRGRLRARARRPGHGARRPRGQHPPRPRRRPARPAVRPQAARRRRRRRSASGWPRCSAPRCRRAREAGERPGARRHPLPHRRDRLPHQRPPARAEHAGDVRRGAAATCRRSSPSCIRRRRRRSSTAHDAADGCSRCASSRPHVDADVTDLLASSGALPAALRASAFSIEPPRVRRQVAAPAPPACPRGDIFRHVRCEDRRSPSPRRAAPRTRRTRLPGTPGTSTSSSVCVSGSVLSPSLRTSDCTRATVASS